MNITDKIVAISRSSALYPKEWQEIEDAPETLYAAGDTTLLQKRKCTVVGSRRTPASALKLGTEICAELSTHFAIVTGTADGGDTAAIEGGLTNNAVVCLLAGGFSALPQSNFPLLQRVAKQGLLLSPHPFDTPVRSFSFDYRNKLLAALGEGTLLLGAGEKSGALCTANYAKRFNKPLFALPYPPNATVGAGCNALIKSGAHLTETAADVFAYFHIDKLTDKKRPPLTADEEKLLAALQTLMQAHVSELSAKAGVPVFKARAILSALEVKGLVVGLGGNLFAPV